MNETKPKVAFECDWCGAPVRVGDPCAFIKPQEAQDPDESRGLLAADDNSADVPGKHDLVCADCTDH